MDDISDSTRPFICQELDSNSNCLRQLKNNTLMQTCYVGFIFKKPPRWRDTKVRFHFWAFSAFLPPPCCLSVRGCLSPFLVSPSRSAPSWQLAMLSVCFSRRWQLLQWSKMDCAGKWRQLSVAVLRDVFALLQRWRTTNPWHPPPPLSSSSHLI